MSDPSQSEKERLFVEVIAYLNEQQRTLILERIKGL